jgi:mannose-6-phosphate isomerase-like protein (cupin superfamily)
MKLDIEKYIASGIIESYCLGGLSDEEALELEHYASVHPEVREELLDAQETLLGINSRYRQAPPEDLEEKIGNAIEESKFDTARFSFETGMLDTFIGISRHSDPRKWDAFTRSLRPPGDYENIYYREIFKDDSQRLAVMWVRKEVPEEIHDDLIEKILILEGACICRLDDETIHLEAGDFLALRPHAVHNLRVTSKTPVKLILTREKLAA